MAGQLEVKTVIADKVAYAEILEDDKLVITRMNFENVRDLTQQLIRIAFELGTPAQLCRI